MASVAVHLARTPHYARLCAWGRATGTWWGLFTWTQRVLTDAGEQGELSVAAWLPTTLIRQPPRNAGPADFAKIALADEQRDWPAPSGWPGWYVGPWLQGDLVLPAGLSPDNRPEWERKRERGEWHERRPRR
jgi:hypothetical protein